MQQPLRGRAASANMYLEVRYRPNYLVKDISMCKSFVVKNFQDEEIIKLVARVIEKLPDENFDVDRFFDDEKLLRAGMLAIASENELITLTPKGLSEIKKFAEEIYALLPNHQSEEDE